MTSIRIRSAISFWRLMSMKPRRLVICRPTKKLRHKRLLFRQRLVLIDGFDRQVVRHADRIFARMNFAVAHENPARGRRQHAGHDLDQRRLAGAVVADETDDLIASDGQIDVAKSVHRAEILLHALEADDRGKIRGRRRHFCSSPLGNAPMNADPQGQTRPTRPAWQWGRRSRSVRPGFPKGRLEAPNGQCRPKRWPGWRVAAVAPPYARVGGALPDLR